MRRFTGKIMAWMELSLDTTGEAVDWACTLLAGTRYRGEIQVVEYQDDPQWQYTIFLYLPEDAQAEAEAMAQVLLPLHRTGIASELQMQRVEDLGVNPAAIRRVNQFVLLSHSAYQPKVGELPLQIQPSLAFGSGLHPATVLSLRLLGRLVERGMKALDLGSGTGILSVAIARMGGTVLAVDNDPIAVKATQETVENNGVGEQVTVMQGSLGQGSEMGHWMGGATTGAVDQIDRFAPFDLVAANILARVHIALAADFRRALRAGGLLVTAGFTTDYEESVIEAMQAAGFEVVDCERMNEWVAIVFS
jgi:ribosomal protein L11 methyltransferase